MGIVVANNQRVKDVELNRLESEIIVSCLENQSWGLVKFYGIRRIQKLIEKLRFTEKKGVK